MKKILTFILISFLLIMKVEAACSSSESNKIKSSASNVKFNHEIVSEVKEYPDGISNIEYFKMTLLNISNDIYVEVTNDVNNDKKVFHSSDTNNGEVSFNWTDIENVTNFKVTIYASEETNCSGEQIKVVRKTTPRYNDYYNREICNNREDFYLCQKYVTFDEVDESAFQSQISSFLAGDVDKNGEEIKEETIMDKIEKYKWYVIGGLIVIVVGTGVIIYFKKRRGNEVKI